MGRDSEGERRLRNCERRSAVARALLGVGQKFFSREVHFPAEQYAGSLMRASE